MFDPRQPASSTPEPGSSGSSSDHTSNSSPLAPTPAKRSSKLDLLIIRSCLALQTVLFGVLALNVSASTFVIISLVLTLGSADSPAFSSLALSLLPSSREAGRLFGALSVIHAIGGTLISPLLFGTLFAYTVGTYAPTVFALATGLLFIALIITFMIRLPEVESPRAAERGRSRHVKRVKSSGGVGGLPKR